MISRLIDDGYIKRKIGKSDRRMHKLYPTQKAIKIYPKLLEVQNALEEWLLKDISEEERTLLRSLMEKIDANSKALTEKIYAPAPEKEYCMQDIPEDIRKVTLEQWQAMKDVDRRTVDKSQLVDLRTVKIDMYLPPRERQISFIRKIKNPYCFRIGDMAVKLKYAENGPTFEEVFDQILMDAQWDSFVAFICSAVELPVDIIQKDEYNVLK